MFPLKTEPTGSVFASVAVVHFYKLNDQIYLKLQINKLFPSVARLAVHLSSEPMPTNKTCHALESNSQIECRHTPKLRKTRPQKGGKCFILSVPQELTKCLRWHNMEGGTVERALDQKTPNVNILDEANPHSFHKCCILSSGLDHNGGFLTGPPDFTLYSAPLLSFWNRDLTALNLWLHTVHGPTLPTGQDSLAKLSATYTSPHSSHLERTSLGNSNMLFPSFQYSVNVTTPKAFPLLPQRMWNASKLSLGSVEAPSLACHPSGPPRLKVGTQVVNAQQEAGIQCSLQNWPWPSFLNKPL